MVETLNLNRSYPLNIIYPVGVKEKIEFTNNDETELSDTFEVVITEQNGSIFKTISEGTDLYRTANKLTWEVNFEHSEIEVKIYNYEIRNNTQDWIEFNGTFKVIKTVE